MFRKVIGNIMLGIGLFIFMLLASVDKVEVNLLQFILTWLSLLGLSISLIYFGSKLAGIKRLDNE